MRSFLQIEHLYNIISSIRLGVVMALISSVLSANNAVELEIIKEKVSQWIQLETKIEKEKASWKQEEVLLLDEVSLLQKDNAMLQEQIAKSLEFIDVSGVGREELLKKRDRLQKLLLALAPEVRKLELGCMRIYHFFPEVLKKTLEEKYNKIRVLENQRVRQDQIGERLMEVLNFFKEIEKFNSKITVAREVISVDIESPREFHVIYIGLAAAYFIDDDKQSAGYGIPSMGSWKFYKRTGLLKEVSTFLQIYNKEKAPSFVRLPVEINQVLSK